MTSPAMRGVPVLAAGLAWLACACSAAAAPEPARPATVVLVVLDSVRADHAGAYGYARPTTPRLDALADGGLVYGRAYAASSVGMQSYSSLWTGRLPTSGGSIGLREAAPHPSLLTLPRLCLRAGYATALAANHADLRERAFTRGFDQIEVDSVAGRWSAGLVTAKALELADDAAGEPLFLTVVYGDAAEPHLPSAQLRARFDVPRPPELLSLPALRGLGGKVPEELEETPGFRDLVARYDAEIAAVDEALGALVDGLSARGRLSDALLVVTSSHGVELLEHGYVGSGWTLHEEVVRVPLVLYAPGLLTPARVDAPVSLVDLVPTLQEALRLERADLRLDGRPLLRAGATGLSPLVPAGEAIAELVIPELCVRRATIRAGWKLVETLKPAPPEARAELLAGYDAAIQRMLSGELPRPDLLGPPLRRELYHLAEDPAETSDVAPSFPDRVELLASSLERYLERCRAEGLDPRRAAAPAPADPDAPEDLEDLQQIGYL